MTQISDLDADMLSHPPTDEQIAAIRRLIASQPDAALLADALGVAGD